MEENEIIHMFRDLFEKEFLPQLQDNIRKGNNFIVMDFGAISKFEPELADLLLDSPEDVISYGEFALSTMDLPAKDIKIRVINLPDTQKIDIWEIRNQLKVFIKVSGYIVKAGEILTIPTKVDYVCKSCNKVITIKRTDDTAFSQLIKPKKCGCGSTSFLPKIYTSNIQRLILEEDAMEVTEKNVPRRKMIILKDDLTSKEIDRQIQVGVKVTINGVLKLKKIKNDSDEMDSYIDVNSIEFVKIGWDVVRENLSESDKELLIELSTDKDIVSKLSMSMFPDIHKHDKVKETILLQLCGAKNIYDSRGFLRTRGNLHVGLLGPPSAGKTYLVKRVKRFCPIYGFTSATTSTGRGLIATVLPDKELGGTYSLEIGMIPKCHKGLAVVDEMDKLNPDDYGHFNNFMNDLVIPINKATIHALIPADTSLLATLNPEGRVFIKDELISDQIVLPPDLLDRFDLMIVVPLLLLEEDQRKIIRISLYKRKENKVIYQQIDDTTILNYISFVRGVNVTFPDELDKYIEDAIVKFTRPKDEKEKEVSNRLFEVVIRLIEASARVHLRNYQDGNCCVSKEDVDYAIEVKKHELRELGLLDESGFIKYESVEGADNTEATQFQKVRNIIKDVAPKVIPFAEIKNLTGIEEDALYDIIEKLKRKMDIFEPKYNEYKWM